MKVCLLVSGGRGKPQETTELKRARDGIIVPYWARDLAKWFRA